MVDNKVKITCEERTDEGLRLFKDNVCGTIRTIDSGGGDKRVIENETNCGYRIRKLTPRECWRLMDFTDNDFDKAKYYTKKESEQLLHKYPNKKMKMSNDGIIERMSDSQLYKQAGNSICVGVPYKIFGSLYKAMPYLFDGLKVGSYFSGIGAFESALDRLYDDINMLDKSEPKSVRGGGERNLMVYDDYNSNVREDQDTIGTITTNIGNKTLRNAYKLIEKE